MSICMLAIITLRCFVGLAISFFQAGALAALPPPPVVGFDIGAPPFFDLHDGRPVGIYPTIVEAIFKDAGEPYTAVPAPFVRVLANVDNGSWGAGGILKTPARLLKYDFSDYIHIESVVAYYDQRRPISVERLADLTGKRVGILRGWSYGEAFDTTVTGLDIRVEAVRADEVNFRKLQLGRLDVVLVLEEVGTELMATGKFPDVVRSRLYIRQNPSYIAFNKKSGRSALLKKLNKSIARLRASGQLSALVRQYLNTAPARGFRREMQDQQ